MSKVTSRLFKTTCQQTAAWLSSVIVLLACLSAGQLFSVWMNQILPGSILGMLFLACLLSSGLIRLCWVEAGANFLVRWMSLLFVPIGAGVIEQFDVLKSGLPAFLLTCMVGTIVIMAFTGWFFQWLERAQ